ncbi:MAG: BCD family MFS transporter [Gemmatimonadaceae bacterium]|nr:BCD family MFS transporter [Gemmatimonadaceae bacterium]
MSAVAAPLPASRVHFGWTAIVRVGVVQACIGALVVLITATMNRVMVIELGLPATLAGGLVALYYTVQLGLRPRMGHLADHSRALPRWIAGGIAILATGVIGAAMALHLVQDARWLGYAALVASFLLVGLGASTAGTLGLTMLSLRVAPERHARAAAIAWLFLIVGFIISTVVAGRLLEPFSMEALRRTALVIGGGCTVAAALAMAGIDRRIAVPAPRRAGDAGDFVQALRDVWHDDISRRFAVFVAMSMVAFAMQDLILEPFAGSVFGLSPADSTRISGVHQGGALVGMLVTAALATRVGTVTSWARWGCVASGAALVAIACAPLTGSLGVLKLTLLWLGIANGCFAIGAIGAMLGLAQRGGAQRAGIRMGVFGAAQAIAQAGGAFLGAVASDGTRALFGSDLLGYGSVFVAEAGVFVVAAVLASAVPAVTPRTARVDDLLAAGA